MHRARRRIRRHVQLVRVVAASPLTCVRVAGWTGRAIRRLRRDLGELGFEAITRLSHAPAAPTEQRRIVSAVLRLAGATCLVRSAVLQRWDADHGRPRALIIGVASAPDGAFAAHAWLEGEGSGGHVELYRRPAP